MNRLENFKGVIPALLTGFDKEGNYDPKSTKEMVDWLASMNASGLYITGHTGHGAVMDRDERMKVVEDVCAFAKGKMPITAHIAAVSSKNSAEMAEHAEKAGCIAVSAVPSYYYKLDSKQMYEYYSEIAEASDLPLIIYAQTANYTPSVEMFRKLSEIKNVEGVKYTGMDHYMMGRIKEHLGKDFMVYSGCDEMNLSGMISGADAVIGSTYNILPDLNMRAIDNLFKGDIKTAQKELLTANAILEVMFKYNLFAALRAGFEFMGVNAGYNPSPFDNLDENAKAEFKKDLQNLKAKSDIESFALFDAI